MAEIVIEVPGNQNQGQNQGYQQPMFQQQGGYQQQQGGFQIEIQQPGYQQPGFQQPGFQQPGFQQPGFQQGGFPQQPQPGFQQPGFQNNTQQQPSGGANLQGAGFNTLQSLDGVFIKQKFNLTQEVTGCVTDNQYTVFAINKDGGAQATPLFKAKESSNCCIRQCCTPECRPFQVEVHSIDQQNPDGETKPFIKIDRPCACTCYCFGRPEVKVFFIENGASDYVGKVIDPCNMCDLFVDVYNSDGARKFRINASCCQLGLHCKWPCEPCQTIDFDVKDEQSGEVISHLQKRSAGCCQTMLQDTANFSVPFPPNATKEEKALMMAAVIFMDYRFFEEQPKKKQNNDGI